MKEFVDERKCGPLTLGAVNHRLVPVYSIRFKQGTAVLRKLMASRLGEKLCIGLLKALHKASVFFTQVYDFLLDELQLIYYERHPLPKGPGRAELVEYLGRRRQERNEVNHA